MVLRKLHYTTPVSCTDNMFINQTWKNIFQLGLFNIILYYNGWRLYCLKNVFKYYIINCNVLFSHLNLQGTRISGRITFGYWPHYSALPYSPKPPKHLNMRVDGFTLLKERLCPPPSSADLEIVVDFGNLDPKKFSTKFPHFLP